MKRRIVVFAVCFLVMIAAAFAIEDYLSRFNGGRSRGILVDLTFGEAQAARRSAYYKGVGVGEAGCGSWLGTWSNRVLIEVDSTNVDGDLIDYPLTVHITNSSGTGDEDISFVFDELTSDGNRKKIAASIDNVEQLYVEIERWTDASELAVLHIKIPTLASASNTTLYLYYDSAQADNTTYVGDTADAVVHNVWDATFAAVFHMNQDPNGDAAGAILDSTSNGYTATSSGNMTSADLVESEHGRLGLDFDGSGDFLTMDTGETIMSGDCSLEIRSRPASGAPSAGLWGEANAGVRGAFSFQAATQAQVQIHHGHWHMQLCAAGKMLREVYTYYVGSVQDNEQYLESWSNDGDAGGGVIGLGGNAMTPDGVSWEIGSAAWLGIIAEFRLSTDDRGDDWMKATYYSLDDNINDFGSEETCP